MMVAKVKTDARNWAATIQAVAVTVGILATVVLQVWNQIDARAAAVKVEAVAVKVEEAKQALEASDSKTEESLEELKKTGDSTHVLVNSQMSWQLKISAVALRRIADLTKDPEDDAAAELAEKALLEHDAKQKKADDKERDKSASLIGDSLVAWLMRQGTVDRK